jgi:hypothetical protein
MRRRRKSSSQHQMLQLQQQQCGKLRQKLTMVSVVRV